MRWNLECKSIVLVPTDFIFETTPIAKKKVPTWRITCHPFNWLHFGKTGPGWPSRWTWSPRRRWQDFCPRWRTRKQRSANVVSGFGSPPVVDRRCLINYSDFLTCLSCSSPSRTLSSSSRAITVSASTVNLRGTPNQIGYGQPPKVCRLNQNMNSKKCFTLYMKMLLNLELAWERTNTLENSANMIKTDAMAGKTSP